MDLKGGPVDVRQAVRKHGMNETAIQTTAVDAIDLEVSQAMEAYIKQAEDARPQAEQSRARADNAYRNAMNLSPEQFLRLESIHMQRDVCVKANCTFIAGDAVPIVQTR